MTDLAPHGGCWWDGCRICNPSPNTLRITEKDAQILRAEPAPIVQLVPRIVIEDDDDSPIGIAELGDVEEIQ